MRTAVYLGVFLLFLVASGPLRAVAQETAADRAFRESRALNRQVFDLYRAGRFAEAIPIARRAIKIAEEGLGPEHPSTANGLNNLAELYRALGQYSAAEPLYVRALAISEKTLGPEHRDLATSLNNLAVLYYAQGQYAQAEPLYRRSLAIREKALGPEHPDVAESLDNLAALYQAQGRYAEAEPLHRRALAIKEKVLGPEHPSIAVSLGNLAGLYQDSGEYSRAESLYRRALAIEEKLFGPEHPSVATSLNDLGTLYIIQGSFGRAQPLLERALTIRERVLGAEHPDVAVALNNLVQFHVAQGQFGRAEPLLRRSLAILEKALGPQHARTAGSLANLAALYRSQGLYRSAESLFRRAVTILENRTKPEDAALATTLGNLAEVNWIQSRYAEAEVLYTRALAIREKVLGPEHPDVASSLNSLGALRAGQRQYARAEPLLRRALTIREKALGAEHPQVAEALNNLVVVYTALHNKYAEAEVFQRRAVAITEKSLGPDHPGLMEPLDNLAFLLVAQQRRTEARAVYERVRRIVHLMGRTYSDLDERALQGLVLKGKAPLLGYMRLLATLAKEPTSAGPPAAALEAFTVAEQLRAGAVQRALANAGARIAASDMGTSSLARQQQDLRNQRQALRKQLDDEYSRPVQQRNNPRFVSLQQRSQEVDRQFAAVSEQLLNAFPAFAELAAPEPIDPMAVRKMLREDEALISFFSFDDGLLIWLLRKDKEPFYRDIPIKKADLAKLVARVRASLDQSTNPNLAVGDLLPFNVAGSHELFKLLVAPVRDQLSGVKHLIFVPDEVLLPIPFGALLTLAEGEPYRTLADLYEKKLSPSVAELTDYAKLSWLAKDYAITVLPSATSLRALRQIARSSSTDVEPFIGFGDPALRGRGTRRGGTMLASRGTNVSVDEIRQLDRLPGTRDELIAVAKALGADPRKALYLDKQATKSMVMSLNSSGRLSKARVVSFATHGLIAGEVSGLKEPALVLTPPEKPSEEDNGLLGLEDILSLKLTNADWVILSACNTAAADGSSEGLSGLVRAFFFTGTPSLLVSHWGVDDRATQALMTEVFRRYARDKTVARSEALRQGMLALMSSAKGNTAYFAHPFAWAPFFLVGEGRD